MNKPVFEENSFSVDDIHKIREWHYEQTKHLSNEEIVKDINKRAEKVRKDIEKVKRKRAAK